MFWRSWEEGNVIRIYYMKKNLIRKSVFHRTGKPKKKWMNFLIYIYILSNLNPDQISNINRHKTSSEM